MKYQAEKLSDIYKEFQTDPDSGLKDQQVKDIRLDMGLNKFEEGKKETVLQKVLHHMRDLTSIILMTAVVISLFLATQFNKGYTDAIVIAAIVVIALAVMMILAVPFYFLKGEQYQEGGSYDLDDVKSVKESSSKDKKE